jgi:hypothetical protein
VQKIILSHTEMKSADSSVQRSKVGRTTISLPPDLLEDGKKLAELDNRDFSNYIATLIKADLEKAREARAA